jgi:hypothetical protein
MDFKKILAWLITSSKDPKQLSLTVKGALLAAAPILMLVTGLNDPDFNRLADSIAAFVFAATTGLAALQVALGLLRKVKFGRWSALK